LPLSTPGTVPSRDRTECNSNDQQGERAERSGGICLLSYPLTSLELPSRMYSLVLPSIQVEAAAKVERMLMG